MPAARPTEAAITRAIRAAQRAGAGAVEIDRGVIRILVGPADAALPSTPDKDEGVATPAGLRQSFPVNGLPWKHARTGAVARQWVSDGGGNA